MIRKTRQHKVVLCATPQKLQNVFLNGGLMNYTIILYPQAVNAVRMEAQLALQKAIMEEKAQKDIAIQHALATARAEMQEKFDSGGVTVVTCDKVTYNEGWASHQAGQNNIVEGILVTEVEEDSDKEK